MVFLLEELQHARNYPSFFRDCIILIFWNDLLAEFNKSFLMKLPGEVYTCNSVDSVDINENEMDHIPQEFLQSQILSGLPLSKLNLKVGAPIILFATYILPWENVRELKKNGVVQKKNRVGNRNSAQDSTSMAHQQKPIKGRTRVQQ